MENQCRDSDDLTAVNPDRDAHADAANGRPDTPSTGPARAVTDAGGTRSRLDRWLAGAIAVAATLFVAVCVFAGATTQLYLADRAADATRTEVARTAAAVITALWSYSPDTIGTLPDRASHYLTGDFKAQYRRFVEAAVGPNKQAAVAASTEVVGAGVESLDDNEAVAMVFTNTTATSPLTKNIPSLKYVAYRLVMRKQGSRWLVANMATVSFMDLTPKI